MLIHQVYLDSNGVNAGIISAKNANGSYLNIEATFIVFNAGFEI